MEYRLVDGKEIFEDNNNGLLFGIESVEDFPEYVEWFPSEETRQSYIKKHDLEMV